MSAALVRKSLALVDPENPEETKRRSRKRAAANFPCSIPESQRLSKRITINGRIEKVNLLRIHKKLTVVDAQRTRKSKEKRLQENLEKIKLIRELCHIELPDRVTQQIVERGITRRPIENSVVKKEESKTVFTEEDFQQFEQEYFGEE